MKEGDGIFEKIIFFTKGYAAKRPGCCTGICGGKFGARGHICWLQEKGVSEGR